MIDLTQYEDTYREQEAQVGGFEDLPDGKYQVRVQTVELGQTRMSGDPILKWQLEVLAGPCAGRYLFRNNLFASADNLKYLKTDLARCGIELARLSDLPDRLEELLDLELEVEQKTNTKAGKTYKNVYIQKRLNDLAWKAGKNGAAGKGDGADPNLEGLPF